MNRKKNFYHLPIIILLSLIFTLTPPFCFASSDDEETNGQKAFIKAAQTLSEFDTSNEEGEKEEAALPCTNTVSSDPTITHTAGDVLGIAGMLLGVLTAGMGLFYQMKGKRHKKKARNLFAIGG